MDPSFFVSPLIHFGLMLMFRHLLNFAELVLIIQAWSTMPYTTYYFGSAVVNYFSKGSYHFAVYCLGFQMSAVHGPLIDNWALGGKCWPLPQLLLQFGSIEKAGFRIPQGLGDQGDCKFVPKWVAPKFPRPFCCPQFV
jgi:hypothetical protein